MIKVYNLKTIMKIFFIFIVIILVLILIKKYIPQKAIKTSISDSSKYKILVDVEDSKLFLFENNELIKTYKCSGGKSSTPSPIGTWTINFKAKWGEGFRTEALWDLMYHGDSLEYMEL